MYLYVYLYLYSIYVYILSLYMKSFVYYLFILFILYLIYIYIYIHIYTYTHIYIYICIYITDHNWSTTHKVQSAHISQKQGGRNIYAVMKTISPPGYHHNGFVSIHAFGHNAQLPQSHWSNNWEDTSVFLLFHIYI